MTCTASFLNGQYPNLVSLKLLSRDSPKKSAFGNSEGSSDMKYVHVVCLSALLRFGRFTAASAEEDEISGAIDEGSIWRDIRGLLADYKFSLGKCKYAVPENSKSETFITKKPANRRLQVVDELAQCLYYCKTKTDWCMSIELFYSPMYETAQCYLRSDVCLDLELQNAAATFVPSLPATFAEDNWLKTTPHQYTKFKYQMENGIIARDTFVVFKGSCQHTRMDGEHSRFIPAKRMGKMRHVECAAYCIRDAHCLAFTLALEVLDDTKARCALWHYTCAPSDYAFKNGTYTFLRGGGSSADISELFGKPATYALDRSEEFVHLYNSIHKPYRPPEPTAKAAMDSQEYED